MATVNETDIIMYDVNKPEAEASTCSGGQFGP